MPEPAPGPFSADGLWADGWLRAARRCPSPNVGARPPGMAVELLVIHSISLPPGQYGGDCVQRLFTNTLDCDAHPYFHLLRGLQVSAHFFIRRTGELWQFAPVQARAWHAGASCWQGRAQCNDFSLGVELEGLEHQPFEPAQYAALAALCQRLPAVCPQLRAVAGHEHIAPGRKQDPGRAFDWPRLAGDLRASGLHWQGPPDVPWPDEAAPPQA